MRISVVGLGKIGLPLAVQYARKGHTVSGVDINVQLVDQVNQGIEPFPGEAHLGEYLESVVANGLLSATTNYSDSIPTADVVVVVVPLFIDEHGQPDFGWMDDATDDIASNLTAGTTVIYETTLPVGTTRDRWAPRLSEKSGLVEGKDFHVVFSPERVLTGRVLEDLRKYPKLVGGLSAEGERVAVDFYRQVLDFDDRPDLDKPNGVWPLGSAESAEMVKLAETTYRDVNIGLANQFARFADKAGIDVYAVIEAANSQPFSHIHQPGIAVGGHCIPVYPKLYLWNDPGATIVDAARKANLAMPAYSVDLLEGSVGPLGNKTVLVLGAAYRGGVKETAFSGVFDVVSELKNRGARPVVYDPMYSGEELRDLGFETDYKPTEIDAVILQANHAEFREFDFGSYPALKAVVDGRRWIEPEDRAPKITVIGGGVQGNA